MTSDYYYSHTMNINDCYYSHMTDDYYYCCTTIINDCYCCHTVKLMTTITVTQ